MLIVFLCLRTSWLNKWFFFGEFETKWSIIYLVRWDVFLAHPDSIDAKSIEWFFFAFRFYRKQQIYQPKIKKMKKTRKDKKCVHVTKTDKTNRI